MSPPHLAIDRVLCLEVKTGLWRHSFLLIFYIGNQNRSFHKTSPSESENSTWGQQRVMARLNMPDFITA